MARYLLRSARELDYYDRFHNMFPRLSLLCADTLCGAIRTFPHMGCQLQATQNGYHRGKCVLNGMEVVLPMACPHGASPFHHGLHNQLRDASPGDRRLISHSHAPKAFHSPGAERHPVQLEC